MPKFNYSASGGIQQSSGSGFLISDVSIQPSSESMTAAAVTSGANASGHEEVILLTLSAVNSHGVSLKDGQAAGQLKHIYVVANGSSADCVIADSSGSTLKTLSNPTAATYKATFVWSGSAWLDIS